MNKQEFDATAGSLTRDLGQELLRVLERFDNPHPAIVGCAIAGIIKGIAKTIEPVDFRNDFLLTIINDLHDFRHNLMYS